MADDFNVITKEQVAARPLKFPTEYVKQADGTYKEVDYVVYAAMGKAQNATTKARIKDIQGTVLWEVFEKYYEAHKKGKETPVNGTPLAVWAGCTPEQAEILRSNGLHSVEDVAGVPSSIANRIRFPGVDNIISNAKRFVEGADQRATEVALAKKDAEISEMQSRMKDMEDAFNRMMEAQEKGDAEPKRRGRPPKQQEVTEDFQPSEVDVG